MGLEQFLNALPKDKVIWVSEKKPKTYRAAGELADEYEQARKREPGMRSESNTPVGKWCDVCKRSGHSTEECWLKEKSGTRSSGGNFRERNIFVVIIAGRKAIRGKTILNQGMV